MKKPPREQQAAITRRVMGKQPPGNMGSKSTEEYLIESIKQVQTAILKNDIYVRTQDFRDSPGHLGLVVTFVTCPDDMAKDMHAALDEAVDRVFKEHGFGGSDSTKPV